MARDYRHEDVLDQIHALRLRVQEHKETSKDRPQVKLSVSKKEKEDILAKYFSAKKHLNDISTISK